MHFSQLILVIIECRSVVKYFTHVYLPLVCLCLNRCRVYKFHVIALLLL